MRSRRFITGTSAGREPRPREPRISPASLILLGLILGLVVGLSYTWLLEPVSYSSASPARLSEEFKEEYIFLISESYAIDNNWERTHQRLEALDDPDIAGTVSTQLENYLRSGKPAQIMRNLAVLAERLGAQGPAVAVFVPLDVEPERPTQTPRTTSPTPTLLPTNTATPRLTRTATPAANTEKPSPTPVPVYRLLKQEQLCRRNVPIPLIEVVVYDAILEPTPGVEIVVAWDGGLGSFFTGYHSEKGPGFGDFVMSPEVVYTVELADGSVPVTDLRIENCGTEQGGLAGGWRLTFQNSDVPQGTIEP